MCKLTSCDFCCLLELLELIELFWKYLLELLRSISGLKPYRLEQLFHLDCTPKLETHLNIGTVFYGIDRVRTSFRWSRQVDQLFSIDRSNSSAQTQLKYSSHILLKNRRHSHWFEENGQNLKDPDGFCALLDAPTESHRCIVLGSRWVVVVFV